MEDKYFKKIERDYIRTTGSFPTIKMLSDYIYERQINSLDFYKFLKELGIGKNGIIAELDKGILDTIFNNKNNYNETIIEIGKYGYTLKNNIKVVDNELILKGNKVKIDNNKYEDYNLSFILDSVIKEGTLDRNKFSLYTRMLYDGNDLYIGCFGKQNDKNKEENYYNLALLKEKIELLTDIKMGIYTNDTKDNYQRVLCKKII